MIRRRLAGIRDLPGPLAVDFRFGHEVAFGVTVRGAAASWITQDGYRRRLTLTARPVWEGQRLLLRTEEHGPVVVRQLEEGDDFYVWPGCSAWQAFGMVPVVRHVVGWLSPT